jgi:hypothetical protein
MQALLNDRSNDLYETYYVKSTIFGPERIRVFLSGDSNPVREDEIKRETKAYEDFVNSFSEEQASKNAISYALTLTEASFDFCRVDKWYERDSGERIGRYTLYRLKPRQ